MNADEFLEAFAAQLEQPESEAAPSTSIRWKKLPDGRIYGFEPAQEVVADEDGLEYELQLTDGEKCTDSAVLDKDYLEQAASASSAEEAAFFRQRAAQARADAAKFALRLRRATRMRLPRPRAAGHRTPGSRRRPGTASRRRTTGTSSSRSDPHLDSEDDEGDRPRLLQQDLEHRLQRVGPSGAEHAYLVDQVAWLGHASSKVNDALEALVARGHLLAVVGDADVDVICWPEGLA